MNVWQNANGNWCRLCKCCKRIVDHGHCKASALAGEKKSLYCTKCKNIESRPTILTDEVIRNNNSTARILKSEDYVTANAVVVKDGRGRGCVSYPFKRLNVVCENCGYETEKNCPAEWPDFNFFCPGCKKRISLLVSQ